MSKNFFGILIVVLLIVTNVSLVLAEENATFLIQNPMLDNGEYSPLGEVPVIIGFGDSLEDKIAELSPEMEGHGPYAVATVSATEVGDKTIFLFKCENGLFLCQSTDPLNAKIQVQLPDEEEWSFGQVNYVVDGSMKYFYFSTADVPYNARQPFYFRNEDVERIVCYMMHKEERALVFQYDGGFGEYTSEDGKYIAIISPVEDLTAEMEALAAAVADDS